MSSMAVGRCGASAIGAAALLLAGCGGSAGGASGAIKSSVNKLFRDRDCSVVTKHYRRTLTGNASIKACEHDLSLRNRVKSISVGSVTSSGSSGTAAVTTDGDKLTLKLVKRDGKWLVDADHVDKASSSAQGSPTSTKAPADTKREAHAKLAAALAPYRAGRKRFEKRALADIAARNLAAVKGDFSQYRDAVFNFDGQLRRIHFPGSARSQLTALLEANRTEISDLDAVGSAASFSELNRLLTTHLKADDAVLGRAIKRLSSTL
jgi:hypothetical protein